MRRSLLALSLAWVSALLGGCQGSSATLPDRAVPLTSRQALLVSSRGWSAAEGRLQRWQRGGDGEWRAVGAPVQVSLGRSGMGWGLGLHRGAPGPSKREGDGRSPAGVFELGAAFGYAATPPAGVTVAYRAADARDYYVDDVESEDYNSWRRIPDGEANDPKARWASCERMRRDDELYELGMIVAHNAERVPGAGSAIFLHVWGGPGSSTSGCTAMSRAELLALLRWLDPEAAPVLVQAPRAELAALQAARR
ncbi:MAG: L,D-transpeptidase family protein [Planctomycetota bacterium]|nr:L,D-transpeptidase family protein [Planctomycetota bacterium]